MGLQVSSVTGLSRSIGFPSKKGNHRVQNRLALPVCKTKFYAPFRISSGLRIFPFPTGVCWREVGFKDNNYSRNLIPPTTRSAWALKHDNLGTGDLTQSLAHDLNVQRDMILHGISIPHSHLTHTHTAQCGDTSWRMGPITRDSTSNQWRRPGVTLTHAQVPSREAAHPTSGVDLA
ncbi:hypothetical protein RRG08_014865 [Elysia crispata]|uniref:Uncharacterized protein n=1 Tax=Elysia crispata TaxID=231223 RepID=A0AAE1E122_9GAST|nr:hypothetical protein RRG08_014865 [Elysia crispata]